MKNLIKELRQKTGAGLMDCKTALEKAGGEIVKAERILKEMGIAAFSKRASNQASEGAPFVYIDSKNHKAGLLFAACETDFMAKSDAFQETFNDLLKNLINSHQSELNQEQIEAIKVFGARSKENIFVRDFFTFSGTENDFYVAYEHKPSSAAIVHFRSTHPEDFQKEGLYEVLKKFSIHIVATSPEYAFKEEVPKEKIDEMRDVFLKQMENSGKPQEILNKIIQGKVDKQLQELVFFEQAFVYDDSVTIKQFLENLNTKWATSIQIMRFALAQKG